MAIFSISIVYERGFNISRLVHFVGIKLFQWIEDYYFVLSRLLKLLHGSAEIPFQQNVPAPTPPAQDPLNLNPEQQMDAPHHQDETIGTAARSETSSLALSSLSVLLRKTLSSSPGEVQLPNFFLVVSEGAVVVRKDPLVEADAVRELAKVILTYLTL